MKTKVLKNVAWFGLALASAIVADEFMCEREMRRAWYLLGHAGSGGQR